MTRKDYQYKYSTKRWLRIRALRLSREPLCVLCSAAGRVTAANEIDHITRVEIWCGDMGRDFYDPENLQELCRDCHIEKGRQENSIGGRLGLKPGETLYDENGHPTPVMLAEIAKRKEPRRYT